MITRNLRVFLLSFFAFNTFFLFSTAVIAQSGTPDSTFHSTGILVDDAGGDEEIHAVLIQPDGKIVVSGYTFAGTYSNFITARYHTDGSRDTTFGSGGIVSTSMSTFNDHATSMALQPDGKIIAAGKANLASRDFFALIRYLPDGTPDSTFESDGKVFTEFGSGTSVGRSIVLQPDGKILATGYYQNTLNDDFAIVRYHPDGSLDNSFSGDGKLLLDLDGRDDAASCIAVQPDGKILVAGTSFQPVSAQDFAVARLHPDGSLDSSFGGTGYVIEPAGYSGDVVEDLLLQPDGKILVAGWGYNGSNFDYALIRWNSDGSLDSTFNGDGKLRTDIDGKHDEAHDMILQADGKIVVAGRAILTSNEFCLVRYHTDGSIDSTFDADGIVNTSAGPGIDGAFALTIQPDGKLVAGGEVWDGSQNDMVLIRYLNLTATASTEIAEACGMYDWNGNLFTTSGTYFDTIPNHAGLDSLMTLHLTVNTLPEVAFTLPQDTVCSSVLPFALTGGSPAGGIYSGPGVSAGVFSPDSAGPGTFEMVYSYTDSLGCSAADTSLLTVEVCAGIHDPAVSIHLSVSPNPTSGMVNVWANENITGVHVYRLTGERVFSRHFSGYNAYRPVDFTPVASGFYLIVVNTPAGNAAAKVIRE